MPFYSSVRESELRPRIVKKYLLINVWEIIFESENRLSRTSIEMYYCNFHFSGCFHLVSRLVNIYDRREYTYNIACRENARVVWARVMFLFLPPSLLMDHLALRFIVDTERYGRELYCVTRRLY